METGEAIVTLADTDFAGLVFVVATTVIVWLAEIWAGAV
jgi:hypothetical protein